MYLSVFKLWFFIRASLSAETPEFPIPFPSRLCTHKIRESRKFNSAITKHYNIQFLHNQVSKHYNTMHCTKVTIDIVLQLTSVFAMNG